MARPRPPRQASAPRRRGTEDSSAAALHSAAVRLLRLVRSGDTAGGLTPPRASALSVLVFGGAMTLGELARAEQVRPPTITRLVQEMVGDGLVRLREDAADRRVRRVEATARGRRLMLEARDRRVAHVAALIDSLPSADRKLLARATAVLARLVARG